MTQDEIIEMARRAGFEDFDRWCKHYPQETQRWCQRMETFANLVAQHERERIKAANAPEIERVNAHIKELERDAARYREVREWDFCGYDHGLISPESVDRAVDNAREQK